MKKMFGLKGEEGTGRRRRKLYNKELHNFNSSPNIARLIK
jgi:hypothetical protein